MSEGVESVREIKFRAWDKLGKRMMEAGVVILDGYDHPYGAHIIDMDKYSHFMSDIELMQYVGFKDKHGKEIYEGDILRHTVEIIETDGSVEVAECYYEALFRQGCFLTRTLDGCYPEYETFADRFSICQGVNMLSDGETIGNIYENPELLEAGDGP